MTTPGCAGSGVSPASLTATAGLVPVRVEPERVIRQVAGLRPYRPSGFVLRVERLAEKVIVHDYGHGGGGVSLSWGTAHLAALEAQQTGHSRAAVIGCGAVGLATARLLQRRGWQVAVYARDLPPETTSNMAGAQWSPTGVFDPALATPAFEAQFQQASRTAYRMFQDLTGPYYGVRWVDNYMVSDEPIATERFQELLPDLYPDVEDIPPRANPFGTRYGRRFATMMIEPPVYLNAVMRDFLLAGGRLVVRHFRDRGELASLEEPVVMNCAGLGSRDLFGDPELVPAKGQLTVLRPQPEVDYIYIDLREFLYMIPRADGILLGGTFETGVWSLDPDPAHAQRIIEGHRRVFGRMRRDAYR
jgi:glycine/D-amino acid oxidase-like deaminating enzyme